MADTSAAETQAPRFIIIGAGMSGILAAKRLLDEGFDDFVVYEKADRLGGTWRENRYPGIACDVPSHLYSYSFALNPEWSQRFAPGPEIQAYLEGVVDRFDVRERIRFGERITRCEFDGERWHVETQNGTKDAGEFVIAASGVLHHPNVPEFEGTDDFEGPLFHSARWPDGLDLAGKRVGVIGTGSSAIQIVSTLVDQVAEVELFQRTAQWVIPMENVVFSEDEKAEFRRNTNAILAIRDEVKTQFVDGFANVLVDSENPILGAMHAACEQALAEGVADPGLRERLTPNYRAGCKRLIMSNDFYPAISKPNADVVVSGIERFEPKGIRTEDGELHELDVVVLATGFKVDAFVRPMDVVGRDGVLLDDVWSKGPTAYLAISVPDMPNFFMLNGPNGPVGNFSLIDVAELEFDYILQLVDEVVSGRCRSIAASKEAMARFDEERREAAKNTIWSTGCQSWYLDDTGLPSAWPFTYDRFEEEMKAPRLGDYESR